MKAIQVLIRADILGRPLQTAAILALTFLTGAMATGSLTVLTRANEPYDVASDRHVGPHLLFTWDAAHVNPAQLMATSHLPGITETGRVHPVVVLPIEREKEQFTVEVVGRDSGDEEIDRYQILDGRWPDRPGEIAVTSLQRPDYSRAHVAIGDHLSILSRADRPTFEVVGRVAGMPQSPPRAFVRSDQVAALTDDADYRLGYELAYRVEQPETDASLAGYTAEIRAALPAGTETAPVMTSVYDRRQEAGAKANMQGPSLVFAVIALVCAALIVGNVITGTILASQRELGIMQAVGFSRRQVVAVMAGQAVVTALIGAAFGILIGILAAGGPLSESADNVTEPPASAVSPLLDLAVLAGIVLVVGGVALLAARHAGDADPARVITLGAAPTITTDGILVRALRSIPLPRPVRLGIGDAFLHPLRSLVTIAVLAIGVATIAFAADLGSLIGPIADDRAVYDANYSLRVERYGPLSDETVSAALAADPDITASLGVRDMTMTFDGSTEPVRATAMRGDTPALDFRASAGRWFDGPGEAVITSAAMKVAGARIGDTVSGWADGRPIRLRIVGAMNDFSRYDDRHIRFDWTTYQTIFPGAAPRQYLIGLRPGARRSDVARRLEEADPHFLQAAINPKVEEQTRIRPMLVSAIGFPTFLLLLIGAVGVFNMIVLNTTERRFDHAILKAIGMTPRQVIVMAASPSVAIALLAIVIGLPLGAWLFHLLLSVLVGEASVDLDQPMFTMGVVDLSSSVFVAVLSMAVAVAGALLPASWAARRPVVDALRAE
jgi:putative ABC transport system permease protein